MENQLTINTGEEEAQQYARLIRIAITGTLKKLFEGDAIEFQSGETTPIYYLLDMAERLEGL